MAEKVGQVRKCPSCGETIESFQTRCSRCGHELNEIKTSETVQEFFQKLEALSNDEYRRDIQREREDKYLQAHKTEKKKKITFGTILLWLFFFWVLWVPIVFRKAKGPYATAMAACGVVAVFSLFMMYVKMTPSVPSSSSVITDVTAEAGESKTDTSLSPSDSKGLPIPALIVIFSLSIVGFVAVFVIMKPKWTPDDKRRQGMVENFPIPDSRNDLIKFIQIATDKVKPVGSFARVFDLRAKRQLEWNNIWIAKCNQVYKQARISMRDDPGSLNLISEMMAEAGVKTAHANN